MNVVEVRTRFQTGHDFQCDLGEIHLLEMKGDYTAPEGIS